MIHISCIVACRGCLAYDVPTSRVRYCHVLKLLHHMLLAWYQSHLRLPQHGFPRSASYPMPRDLSLWRIRYKSRLSILPHPPLILTPHTKPSLPTCQAPQLPHRAGRDQPLNGSASTVQIGDSTPSHTPPSPSQAWGNVSGRTEGTELQ